MSISAPTVTGFSGFWEYHAPTGQAAPYAMRHYRNSTENRIAFILGRPGIRGIREIMYTLAGAATGSAASDTNKRIKAPAGLTETSAFGGSREIETVTNVSANTAAADLTYMQDLFNRYINLAPAIASYPTDASGNGGGGKLGI